MNKEKLLILMKEWLNINQEEDLTILQLYSIINSHEQFRIEMFYMHFAPLMAQVIDGDL